MLKTAGFFGSWLTLTRDTLIIIFDVAMATIKFHVHLGENQLFVIYSSFLQQIAETHEPVDFISILA